MFDYYMLDKVLDKITKLIGIEKFEDTKLLIDTDDKLPGDIILRNVVILIACVRKDDGKFYPQKILEETFFLK